MSFRLRPPLATLATLACFASSAWAGPLAAGGNYKNENHSNENHCCSDLSGALLKGVDFSNTDLRGSNLSGANLKDANLSGALLDGADLSGANLRQADLTGARYDGTTIWPSGFDPQSGGAVLAPALPPLSTETAAGEPSAIPVPAAERPARGLVVALLLAGARAALQRTR